MPPEKVSPAVIGPIRQSDGGQDSFDSFFKSRAAEAVELAEESEILAGGQFAVDGEFLRHDADATAKLLVPNVDWYALEKNFSRRRFHQA